MLTLNQEHNSKIHPMKPLLSVATILLMIAGCSLIDRPQVAPSFTIELYSTTDHAKGDIFNLEQQQGSPTFINFWFPSCPPCVAEMPQFNKFYMQNKNEVNVVAVQLIGLDSMEDGQKFVDDKSIDFAVGPDTTGKVSVDYQISVYPTTIFVDSEGNIAEYWQGEINAEELEQKLTNLQRSKD